MATSHTSAILEFITSLIIPPCLSPAAYLWTKRKTSMGLTTSRRATTANKLETAVSHSALLPCEYTLAVTDEHKTIPNCCMACLSASSRFQLLYTLVSVLTSLQTYRTAIGRREGSSNDRVSSAGDQLVARLLNDQFLSESTEATEVNHAEVILRLALVIPSMVSNVMSWISRQERSLCPATEPHARPTPYRSILTMHCKATS